MQENKMGTMPIDKLIISMSLPIMISMLVQALYNIVDSIFVAQISENALTAVSMAFPIQNLMIAVGVGTAVGVNALLARSLGERDFDKVNKIAENAVFLVLLSYLLFLIIGLFFAEPILIFGLFGFPKMGITGAAAATVIGQMIAAVLAVVINQTRNKEIQLSLKSFRPDGTIIGQIYAIGVPSIVMQAIGSVMNYGMNSILISFSSTATAVFGVYFKLQSFVFMPAFGLNNGVIPVMAYNYGAGSRERVVKTLRHTVTYAVCIMAVGLLIFQLFPTQLLKMFSASDTMLSLGVPALRIISLSFILAGFGISCSSIFQALGKAVYSMFVSIARQLVALLPVAYFLAQFGNVNLIWWAFPIAELISIIMTIIFMFRIFRTIVNKIGEKEMA